MNHSARNRRVARAVRTQLHTQIGEAYERLLAEYPDAPAMFARRLGLLQAQRIVTPFDVNDDEAQCEVCGCTENDACEGGCSWVTGSMSDLCSACVVPARREVAECAVLGCGVQSSYLDVSIGSRQDWIEVRQNSSGTDSRWYHCAQCAAAALTAGSAVRPGKVTPAGGGITQAAASEPLRLTWTRRVDLPGPGSEDTNVKVFCTTADGTPAEVWLEQEERLPLASLLELEVRDINRPCGRPGCGTPVIGTDSADHPRWYGWAQVRVVGPAGGLRWACSPPCVSDALARAGVKLAAADEAAEIEDQRAGDSVFGIDSGLGW